MIKKITLVLISISSINICLANQFPTQTHSNQGMDISIKPVKANDKSKDDEELKKYKEEVKKKINAFGFNTSYISEFVSKVDMAKSIEDVNKIYKQAEELNNEVGRIRKRLEDIIDCNDRLHPENEEKNRELFSKELDILNKARDANSAKKAGEQIFNDPQIMKYEKEYKLYKQKEYLKGYLDAFYYKNNNNFDNYNDDIFFDLKLGGDVSSSSFLSTLTLGGTHKLGRSNLKLGGFVQYDYQTSHNISLGTSVVYDNFLGFVRYRLATYKGKINHNVDVFGKYYYEFKFNKLKIVPIISLYSTVSSKVNVITENEDGVESVYISPRIGFDLNLGTKLSYQILKNLSIFTEPTITVSYNDQRVKKDKVNRSYFEYDINFGVEYKEKGVGVKPILRLTGDMLGNTSISSNIGIGYKF